MVQPETTASFGYWVRRQRLALDLTQADLARKVGCATVTITKIERDERRPSRQIAELLADCLAIPATEKPRFIAVALGEKAVDTIPLPDRPLTASAETRPSTLPVPATPFVGRRQELDQLTEKLNNPACRLLTLAGPGGTGKTRLGIRLGELAREQVEQYPDGVYFVALDSLDSPALVVPAIAEALRFTFYKQTDQTEQLLRYLAGKRLLLILDNAEGILERTLAAKILTAAPHVKLIVTSREALQVQHEWFFPLAGMRLPDTTDGDNDSWKTADAVQLFAENALRARPDFDLAREQVHVTRICRLVDGAPLAIELAAAWLRILPCAQIAEEVEQGIDLLATTLHDVPERHRSMSVVLEQSWRQLSDEEQRVFRQLSVFSGQFHPRAAQSVAEAWLQTLASLVERSMIQLSGDGYYRIHLLLQRLGAEKLASDATELADAQARHAGYYMNFLAARREAVAGLEQARVLAEIQAEFENVRSAWQTSVRLESWEALESALPCLFRVLWIQGRYQEGEALLASALERADRAALADDRQALRIVLAVRHAQLGAAMGAYQSALAQLETVRSEMERWRTPGTEALYHFVSGVVAEESGKPDLALEHLRAGHALYSRLGDNSGTAECAMRLGFVIADWEADLPASQKLCDEALSLYRRLGDLSNIADALNQRGYISLAAGKLDEGERFYTESLALARKIDHQLVVAKAIGGLGLIPWQRKQWKSAIVLLQERLELMQALGYENEILVSLNLLLMLYAEAEMLEGTQFLRTDHLDMWQSTWTTRAQTVNTFRVGQYLVIWAILLLGERALVRSAYPKGDFISIGDEERFAQAIEILTVLQTSSIPLLRRQAQRLLARDLGKRGIPANANSTNSQPARSMDEIARDLLNIRLAQG